MGAPPKYNALTSLAVQRKMVSKLVAKRRKEKLEALMESKLVEEREEAERWIARFDENKTNKLERGELVLLLRELEPHHSPTPTSIEYVLEHAKAIKEARQLFREEHGAPIDDDGVDEGDQPEAAAKPSELVAAETGIAPDQLRAAVIKYKEFGKRASFLDEVLQRFDRDRSGKLEHSRGEIKPFLQAMIDGSLTVKGNDDVESTYAMTFKLQKLVEARQRGLLSERSLNMKWSKTAGIPPPPPEMRRKYVVDDADVDFVLATCDKNRDGAIDRDEIMASVSVWLGLILDDLRKGSVPNPKSFRSPRSEKSTVQPASSQACSLM